MASNVSDLHREYRDFQRLIEQTAAILAAEKKEDTDRKVNEYGLATIKEENEHE